LHVRAIPNVIGSEIVVGTTGKVAAAKWLTQTSKLVISESVERSFEIIKYDGVRKTTKLCDRLHKNISNGTQTASPLSNHSEEINLPQTPTSKRD
jgi:hypothetical protein